MSQYKIIFQNKSEEFEENFPQDMEELFSDHQKHLDFNYLQSKELQERNNCKEKTNRQDCQYERAFSRIELSRMTINNYVFTKRGKSNQTMELLPNFKTSIVRKIKDVLLIKILNKEQTANCIVFIKTNPSFKSLKALLHPIQSCKKLRNILLELFSSPQIVRELMISGIRLSQKQMLLKYLERMRDQVQNPGKMHRWKNIYR